MPLRALAGPVIVMSVVLACGSAPGEAMETSGGGETGGSSSTTSAGDGSTGAGSTSTASAPTGATTGVMTGELPTTAGESSTGCGDEGCRPIACPKEGGVYCGGNGVGGDPQILYVCEGGALQVLEDCGEMCIRKPLGTPDVCPGDSAVPASLIEVLDVVPYVEQDCAPTQYPGWPHEALHCTYTVQGVQASVDVANPSPARVGAWIVDAAGYIPALAQLQGVDDGAYEQGLAAIALHMLYQSSRIFPLTGDIVEDLGNGAELFPFNDGVSDPCGSGCYCRINSLHRTQWCEYRASLRDSYDGCIAELGASGHTPAWAGQCLANHAAAWTADANEHFRARAFVANQGVAGACPPGACTPGEVVAAVESAYGL